MDKDLSIIFPIYNVENYLHFSIDSILKTKYLDSIEIILVDDGSTDGCGIICDEYVERYSCIKTFHKKNGGIADSRNFGLLRASGRYVYFADPDDFLSDQAINRVIDEIRKKKVEVILFDAQVVDEKGNSIQDKRNDYFCHLGLKSGEVISGIEAIRMQLITKGDYPIPVWLCVCDRNFIIRGAHFYEPQIIHEDELWTPKILVNAKSVSYIQEKLYFYRIRENSFMKSSLKNSFKNISSLIYVFHFLAGYLDLKDIEKETKSMMTANLSKRYLHMLYHFSVDQYPELYKRIDRIFILKNAAGLKDKTRAIILFFSISLYCKLMRTLTKE